MSYRDTFILVAEDCPVRAGVVPTARGEAKTVPVLQHELLTQNPYGLTQDDLLFTAHVRHKAIPADVLVAEGEAIRAAFFAKPHPCLRASALPKRYGWGVHYDAQGRIALYGADTDDYRRLSRGGKGDPAVVRAMRNRRG